MKYFNKPRHDRNKKYTIQKALTWFLCVQVKKSSFQVSQLWILFSSYFFEIPCSWSKSDPINIIYPSSQTFVVPYYMRSIINVIKNSTNYCNIDSFFNKTHTFESSPMTKKRLVKRSDANKWADRFNTPTFRLHGVVHETHDVIALSGSNTCLQPERRRPEGMHAGGWWERTQRETRRSAARPREPACAAVIWGQADA